MFEPNYDEDGVSAIEYHQERQRQLAQDGTVPVGGVIPSLRADLAYANNECIRLQKEIVTQKSVIYAYQVQIAALENTMVCLKKELAQSKNQWAIEDESDQEVLSTTEIRVIKI